MVLRRMMSLLLVAPVLAFQPASPWVARSRPATTAASAAARAPERCDDGGIASATRRAIASTAAATAALALLSGGPLLAHALDPNAAAPIIGASDSAAAKIQGGGASTLQSGRIIAITRGVNLDNTDWEGKSLKGIAFQQSVMRNTNFKGCNLFTASFFDADLNGASFVGADMKQVNLEMADLTKTDLTNADLTEAYMSGAVINGLEKITGSDWTDAQLRKDQRIKLCSIADGTNPKTGVDTKESLMCP